MNEEIPTIVHTCILRCICVRFDCTFAMLFFYYAHVVICRVRQTCIHSINTCMCIHIDTVSTAPVKPQERQRHGLGNTRARRTNTANRAPTMLMHHEHVSTGLHDFHLVEFSHQPVPSPVKQQVETTG